MPLQWPAKDPDEVLDYTLRWSRRLDGDTIDTSSWTIDDDALEQESNSNTDTTTTVWLSGGTIGEKYTLTNRVVTAGGRTMEESVTIRIRER